jgi:hypothetical protein
MCPVCLRPRGKLEITKAYGEMRLADKQRRRRPFVAAGYLLAAGAAGGLAYRFREPMIAATVSARARLGRLVSLSMDSADPAADRAAAPSLEARPEASTPPAAPAPPAAPVFAPVSSTPILAAAVKSDRRPARVEDLPLPTIDADTQWVLYGRVYDLITLLPVPDAPLDFKISQGEGSATMPPTSVRSDRDGRFAVELRRLSEGSYEIRASREGYSSPVLYEPDIPYARLDLATRREIVRGAQDDDMTLPPLTDVAGELRVRRDLFLAPIR